MKKLSSILHLVSIMVELKSNVNIAIDMEDIYDPLYELGHFFTDATLYAPFQKPYGSGIISSINIQPILEIATTPKDGIVDEKLSTASDNNEEVKQQEALEITAERIARDVLEELPPLRMNNNNNRGYKESENPNMR